MAFKAQGTDLYVIDPRTNTVLDVGCITSLDGIDSAIDQIETTCLRSSERTYLAGLGTPGTATFGLQIDPTNPVHVKLYELKQLGLTLEWAVGWSDDGPKNPDGSSTKPPTGVTSAGLFHLPTTRSWITFAGFMNAFPFTFGLNAVVSSTVGIQVSGGQTLIPKS
jgi:hypothetical protein